MNQTTLPRLGRVRMATIGALCTLGLGLTACGFTEHDVDVREKFRHLPAGSDQLNDIEVELYLKAVETCGTAMNVKGVDTHSKGVSRDSTSVTCHYPDWMAGWMKPDPD